VLNSILWCFYKETTARFEQPERVANHQAVSEGDYSVKIEVHFEHNGEDYLVSREIDERSEEEDFKAFLVKKGNFTKLDAPGTFVDSVAPREMARYFFFDGEFAETFSSQNNKAKVREALENMLGCRMAIQAIKDLNSLNNEIEKQVAGLTKNNQSAVFQEKIDQLIALNEKENSELIVHESNLDAAKDAEVKLLRNCVEPRAPAPSKRDAKPSRRSAKFWLHKSISTKPNSQTGSDKCRARPFCICKKWRLHALDRWRNAYRG